MAEFKHVPVLLQQCLDGLDIKPDGCYMDGTVGGAGHSSHIAKALGAEGRLYCFDKDPQAIAAATERLAEFPNVNILRGDFRDAQSLLGGRTEFLDGALLDLGVSSHQLDSAERGFSYNKEGALDMRMADNGTTAADIVNTASFEQLCRICDLYGVSADFLLGRKLDDSHLRRRRFDALTPENQHFIIKLENLLLNDQQRRDRK